MSDISNVVVGYVYDNYGYYKHKYYFEGTAEKIANFIMEHRRNKVVITDLADLMICESTPGGFINYCPDQEFLMRDLQPEIIPIQRGDYGIKPLKFEFNGYDYYEKSLESLLGLD